MVAAVPEACVPSPLQPALTEGTSMAAASSPSTEQHDVIVVGAGVTGLVTAYRLLQAGREVTVLEARDRIGGRLRNETHDEEVDFEVGGQWVSPDQTALIALLDELGPETFKRYREGESLYVGSDGIARRFTDEMPVPEHTNAEIERLYLSSRRNSAGDAAVTAA